MKAFQGLQHSGMERQNVAATSPREKKTTLMFNWRKFREKASSTTLKEVLNLATKRKLSTRQTICFYHQCCTVQRSHCTHSFHWSCLVCTNQKMLIKDWNIEITPRSTHSRKLYIHSSSQVIQSNINCHFKGAANQTHVHTTCQKGRQFTRSIYTTCHTIKINMPDIKSHV